MFLWRNLFSFSLYCPKLFHQCHWALPPLGVSRPMFELPCSPEAGESLEVLTVGFPADCASCLLESKHLSPLCFKYGGRVNRSICQLDLEYGQSLYSPPKLLEQNITLLFFFLPSQMVSQWDSNCLMPGPWLAPPVTHCWVSLAVVGILAIWLVLQSLKKRKKTPHPAQWGMHSLPAVPLW